MRVERNKTQKMWLSPTSMSNWGLPHTSRTETGSTWQQCFPPAPMTTDLSIIGRLNHSTHPACAPTPHIAL
eukprot:4208969-Lingulodinium_polyedra.AAC.1